MKKFRTSLREHATKVLQFEKKKMLLLTKRAKITPRFDRMLYVWENILKKVL